MPLEGKKAVENVSTRFHGAVCLSQLGRDSRMGWLHAIGGIIGGFIGARVVTSLVARGFPIMGTRK